MNYQKIYDQLVERARSEGRKKVKGGIYYEHHHIIPKCLGGLDNKENLVLLTGREHFIAHKLLVEIYPNNHKLIHAVWMMTVKVGKGRIYIVTSRDYERYKIMNAKSISLLYSGENSYWFGKRIIVTEEVRKKRSINSKGGKNPMYGKRGTNSPLYGRKHDPRTSEQNRRNSEKQKNRVKIVCEYCGVEIDICNIGRHRISCLEKIEKSKLIKIRKPVSDTTIKKRLDSHMKRPIVKCPYCEVSGRGSGMKMYHFDNCKQKPGNIIKEDIRAIIICPHCGKEGKVIGAMLQWHFDNCRNKKF